MTCVKKDQILRLFFALIPSAGKRTRWLFYSMGDHVHFQPRVLPADPKFIKLHSNIAIAANVSFITHDIIHAIFNNMDKSTKYKSHLGCIEVKDNVFIGARSIIMPDVVIGPNAIVAAGSLANKDVPEGSVVAGVPARVIGSFDDLMQNLSLTISKSSFFEAA